MASSFSSSSSSSNADPRAVVTVSQDEFNQFHNIDRILFTRLIVSLGRDLDEATRAVAYLLWLEKMSRDFRLVSRLLQWPDPLLNGLVNEAMLALNCIESDQFRYDVVKGFDDLPLTQSVTQRNVTLRYLHENRVTIMHAVTKIINDVCVRAFADIVQKVQREKVMYNDCAEGVGEGEFQKNEMPPDERTIFLTFSKGYPISEAELRDYFSRYGDIIEAVHMQEVQVLEQPLYARLVVRSMAMNVMDIVLQGTAKVKFTINGKHVWARKYVRKTTKSPPKISPPLSPSNSPSPSII